MTKSFAQLFKESLEKTEIKLGSIICGTIVDINKDIVLVDAGFKSESAIPIEQFYDTHGKLNIKLGDKVDVVLDAIEDGFGETILSREKAKRYESWLNLEKSYKDSSIILGTISSKVKGGFTVEIDDIKAFLPGSLVDIKPIRDSSHLEGKKFEFKVIKLDKKRNNVVVSRKAVIESEYNFERNQLLNKLQDNIEIKGIVKNLTDYGAFIDMGGIDGLLHITDMSWRRIKHPSEILSIGDEIKIKILKFDKDKNRVSLGLKQLSEDPWISIAKRYPEGTRLKGVVTNLTDYGCFVEIEEGVEGLVHVSEMDWTNKNIHPAKVVNIKDQVDVVVLDIDIERRRISLGIKQCKTNPWKKFSENYNKGDKVSGIIKSITDFGIFIGLDGNIDGLVHLSDISWHNKGEEEISKYKKGDMISAIVLQIDTDRERISLGIKQLTEDPLINFYSLNKKENILSGIIVSINNRSILVKLKDGIEGCIRDFDNTEKLKVGDLVKTKIVNIDRKNRIINLTLKVKNETDKKEINKLSDKNFSNVMKEAFKAATKNE